MKRSLILLLPLLLLHFGAGDVYGQAGKSGLAFLKLGAGSRSLALGEASSVLAADPSALYYNPATLTRTLSPRLLLMHREGVQKTQTEFLGASTVSGNFAFAAGMNATSVGDIELRDVPGPSLGVFTARSTALSLAIAYKMSPALALGATGSFLYEKILIEDASGYAMNLGALYSSPWGVDIGAAVNNLGSMGTLHTTASELPTSFRIGAADNFTLEKMHSIVSVGADLVSYTKESSTHLHIGAEAVYNEIFALRAGYQTGYDAKSLSAGVGILYEFLVIDYAFVPHQYDLGSSHVISLGVNF